MAAITDGGIPVTEQKTVDATATLLVPAVPIRPYRSGFVIQNVGTVDVYIGGAGVTVNDGILLIAQAGATVAPATFANATSNAAYYGITAAGGGTVNVLKELM